MANFGFFLKSLTKIKRELTSKSYFWVRNNSFVLALAGNTLLPQVEACFHFILLPDRSKTRAYFGSSNNGPKQSKRVTKKGYHSLLFSVKVFVRRSFEQFRSLSIARYYRLQSRFLFSKHTWDEMLRYELEAVYLIISSTDISKTNRNSLLSMRWGVLDSNICPYENLHNNQTKSRYFSPHAFHQAKSKSPNNRFSVFDNNITSLNQHLEIYKHIF